MVYGALFVGLLLAGATYGALRSPSSVLGSQWLVVKEGVVHLAPFGSELYRWTSIRGVDGSCMLFEGDPEVMLLPGRDPAVVLAELSVQHQDGRVDLGTTVNILLPLLADPAGRSALPTFCHPEGPPAAVLAGLEVLEPTMRRRRTTPFATDLEKLCAALEPVEHAKELALLQSCKKVDDLVWLSENNGGWLTEGTRDPKLKLVRHGSGTFLVVRYDKGWSSTVSQAPFQTR